MIINLIRLIRGYVYIRLEGVFSEKILSALAENNISVWSLRYSKGVITAKIYAKDFKKLRKVRKNTGVKVKIIKKRGVPFWSKKYLKRSGFLAGAVIFFVILKFLSLFVWVINVEGNTAVKTGEILKTLKKIGIKESMKISAVDSKNDAQNLLLNRNDLAWASLNVEGCVLNVNVSEIKEKKEESISPANLVALKDGIVKRIDAVSGDVKVKVGQNVHKGDILVSGIIENLSSTVFVRSNAKIIAQVEKTYQNKMSFLQKENKKTGKSTEYRVIDFLSVKIPLFFAKPQKEAYISYKVNRLKLFDKKIPLTVYTKRYDYYKPKNITLTADEVTDLLNKKLSGFLNKKEIEGYIPIGTEYKTEDDGITVTHRYLCDENIAREREILLSQ